MVSEPCRVHGVMGLLRVCACVRRRQTNGSGSSSATSATLPPLTLITTHPTHLSLSSSGCPLSGHGERPRRRWGGRGWWRGWEGRTSSWPCRPARHVPSSLGRLYCVPFRGKRGGRVQARPKGVEPALSCASTACVCVCMCVCPSRRRDLAITTRRRANVRATAYSLPPAAGCTVRRGLERGLEMARGRQLFRGGRGAVRAKPSTMKASTDSLSCPSAAGV